MPSRNPGYYRFLAIAQPFLKAMSLRETGNFHRLVEISSLFWDCHSAKEQKRRLAMTCLSSNKFYIFYISGFSLVRKII
jgi:hypothetical protein